MSTERSCFATTAPGTLARALAAVPRMVATRPTLVSEIRWQPRHAPASLLLSEAHVTLRDANHARSALLPYFTVRE